MIKKITKILLIVSVGAKGIHIELKKANITIIFMTKLFTIVYLLCCHHSRHNYQILYLTDL